MYKTTFYIPKPPNCTHEQFVEYLKTEITNETLDDDNPLTFYEFSNDVVGPDIVRGDTNPCRETYKIREPTPRFHMIFGNVIQKFVEKRRCFVSFGVKIGGCFVHVL